MKKTIYWIILIILIMIIIPINIKANSTTQAKELIDTSKNVNLSIYYKYDNLELNNINVKIYYIASVNENYQYTLDIPFNKYSINLNGIESSSEWNNVKQTLEFYISADKIDETLLLQTKNNSIHVDNLKTGVYLVVTEKVNTNKYILEFDSLLISLPNLNENGYFDYEVKANTKAISYIPRYEELTYTVTKEWEDDKKKHPKSVEIEIYKDEKYVEKQILSSENNWSYSWITQDDGSDWIVVERNIPQGYNVSISKEGNKFNMINSIIINPSTSDNIIIYFYGFIISFVVLIGIIIYLIIKKKELTHRIN